MKHTEYIIPIGEEAKDYDEIFIGVLRKHKELIRCKDCKKRAFGRWCGNYPTFQPEVSDDHYCADAERR